MRILEVQQKIKCIHRSASLVVRRKFTELASNSPRGFLSTGVAHRLLVLLRPTWAERWPSERSGYVPLRDSSEALSDHPIDGDRVAYLYQCWWLNVSLGSSTNATLVSLR
ncbi:hypothetical protein AB1N83_002088 [Pleurotus pulmonarius]